ncbi:MAG: hypothetical protein ACHP6H_01320, partial [Legionellales bacterium]
MKKLLFFLTLLLGTFANAQLCPPEKLYPTDASCSSNVTDNGVYADYMKKDTIYHILTGNWLPVNNGCPNPPVNYPCYNGESMINDWGIYANYVADDSIKAALSRFVAGGGLYSIPSHSVVANTTGSSGVPASYMPYSSYFSTNNLVSRNTNGNIITNNFIPALVKTNVHPTLTLTASSPYNEVLTNTSISAVNLPDARTLHPGHRFEINNNASSVMQVNDNTSGFLFTMPLGTDVLVTLTDSTTQVGTWDYHWSLPKWADFVPQDSNVILYGTPYYSSASQPTLTSVAPGPTGYVWASAGTNTPSHWVSPTSGPTGPTGATGPTGTGVPVGSTYSVQYNSGSSTFGGVRGTQDQVYYSNGSSSAPSAGASWVPEIKTWNLTDYGVIYGTSTANKVVNYSAISTVLRLIGHNGLCNYVFAKGLVIADTNKLYVVNNGADSVEWVLPGDTARNGPLTTVVFIGQAQPNQFFNGQNVTNASAIYCPHSYHGAHTGIFGVNTIGANFSRNTTEFDNIDIITSTNTVDGFEWELGGPLCLRYCNFHTDTLNGNNTVQTNTSHKCVAVRWPSCNNYAA